MGTIDEFISGNQPRPVIIAHRGASHYFHENTLEAFQAAVDMRPEMVEFDVRRTADGVLVVHHDPDIAGREIGSMSMTRIREAAGKAGYLMPTLVEVLRYCAGKIAVDIELKEAGYEDQVLDAVLAVLEPDQFLMSSAHDAALARIKAIHPAVRTGLVLSRNTFPAFLGDLFPSSRVRATGADVIVVSMRHLRLGFRFLNRRLGKPLWVFTVNDRKDLWDLITGGRVGAIFTDRPDVALFLRDLHTVSQHKVTPPGIKVPE